MMGNNLQSIYAGYIAPLIGIAILVLLKDIPLRDGFLMLLGVAACVLGSVCELVRVRLAKALLNKGEK
jgi:hypothetical protein